MSIREQNQVMVDFFKKMPAHLMELSLVGKTGFRINGRGKLDLTPVIDDDFLPEPIEELRKKAPQKTILTGVAEYESLLFSKILQIILLNVYIILTIYSGVVTTKKFVTK